jgi:hypothetical protein
VPDGHRFPADSFFDESSKALHFFKTDEAVDVDFDIVPDVVFFNEIGVFCGVFLPIEAFVFAFGIQIGKNAGIEDEILVFRNVGGAVIVDVVGNEGWKAGMGKDC